MLRSLRGSRSGTSCTYASAIPPLARQLGERIGQLPGVSHCYRRPRRLPSWPYNLFAMLHGRTRAEVEQQAVQLRELLGSACRGHDILYSTAILKKTGLRLRQSQES